MRKSLLLALSLTLGAATLAAGHAEASTLGTNSSIIVVGGSQLRTYNPAGPRMLNPQPLPPRWLGGLSLYGR